MAVKVVKIKLFKPGNKGFVTLLTKAGPGRRFTAEGIAGILKQFVDKLDAAMPDRYRMVEIGAGEFNFVRKPPPPTVVVSYAGREVAELKRLDGQFTFRYLAAFQELNLSPLPGLPQGSGDIIGEDLPLFFKERLPDLRRPEIGRWLELHPEIDRNDELQLLGSIGVRSVTDSFVLTRRPSPLAA